jgi:hypothetical protein
MDQADVNAESNSERLTVINSVLDFIRGNLANIERVWGRDSMQYVAANSVMQEYLDENLRKMDIQHADLADLLQGLSIGDPKPATVSTA